MSKCIQKSWPLIMLSMICMLMFTGCGCEHEWKEADCNSPKVCILCGETEGERLEHEWQEASCTSARSCINCGTTEGEALPHTLEEASCDSAQKCTVCGMTEGVALGHSWTAATYSTPKTCLYCGLTEGDVLKVHDGNVFAMTIDEFDDTYNEMLRYYYSNSVLPFMVRSLESMIIDVENLPGPTEGDSQTDYSQDFDLMGTHMAIHCYADADSENISHIVFDIDEKEAKEYRVEIAEDLNDYLVDGLIAYSVVNPKISFMEAGDLYASAVDKTEGGRTSRSFTYEGVTFKSTIGYCYLEIEIYIEE